MKKLWAIGIPAQVQAAHLGQVRWAQDPGSAPQAAQNPSRTLAELTDLAGLDQNHHKGVETCDFPLRPDRKFHKVSKFGGKKSR